MSTYTDTLIIQVSLTEHGDALIYGASPTGGYAAGLTVKQRLFAWHEPSFYGTELETQKVQELELVVLPSEQVIPFFAERHLLTHIEWVWEGDAAKLAELAPLVAASLEARSIVPSFAAYRKGKLAWLWDEAALETAAVTKLRKVLDARGSGEAGDSDEDGGSFADGFRAAFSAAAFARRFGSEEAAADLRRDYPLLFARERGGIAAAGMDARAWLVAIGWKADTAPFRPLLQLLEPIISSEGDEHGDGSEAWRLQLVLQDRHEPSMLAPARLTRAGEALGSWPAAWSAHVHERSAAWLSQLQANLPEARLAGGGSDLLNGPLSDAEAWQFLTEDSQRLLSAGWQVLLPGWWEAASKRKPRLRAKVGSDAGDPKGKAAAGGKSLFGLDSLIDFDWRIAIGDSDLTESEFAELVARGERLVRFRGEWVSLDPALIAQIRSAMARVGKNRGLTFQEVLQLHLIKENAAQWAQRAKDEKAAAASDNTGEDERDEEQVQLEVQLEVELNEHLKHLMGQLTQQSEWPEVPIPAGLQAELRSYQKDGFAWLAFLRRFGLGACLADDMGLGKTVQFITYLLHVKEQAERGGARGPALLICPTSVLGNWQKEVRKFAPSLRIMLHYGSKRLTGDPFCEAALEADIVLTSFATAALDQETISTFHWSAICLDEAQNIKNAGTKQSVAVRSFHAKHRIALTGTPIENRLSELWSIYDFINPGYLGNARSFNEQFVQAIERERDEEKTQELQKLVKPFMLRRKKKDPNIQLDLPDKNEMKTYIHLTAEQGALYDQTVNELMTQVPKLEGIQRKGAILSALTQLKQLCDHPILLTKEPIPEISESGEFEESESLIIRSAKLERLLAMVRELREEGERCLIFTQYIGMGQMLQRVLAHELQEPVLYLHGGTSKTGRDRMIEQFQSQTLPAEEQPNVFILSIKAGGVGLNLTAANHVFHFDRWWNPAVENQATDRAYRMGQTRDVQVHKFISLGTLEERIDEMLVSKQQLSDNVITSSEGWITELSTDALKDLFTLRRDLME
ncbi:SNF2 family DNA or RNA helicase [Paenibacillus taihuensis]|uniref:SNF2 family DNA or RNA helicase n=1 Tax=Paenibacillus taihuensis TaxID=1156355 RepID=A0A3D9S1N5_9BACL|nr:DEAD/DEAH box helicase [Paenibacillus taihuensis]REE86517.1 SNF2 family DNA or RNA helicase [Paenibacillus taihuensis]